jgi:hypothetical protein
MKQALRIMCDIENWPFARYLSLVIPTRDPDSNAAQCYVALTR